MSKLMLVLGIVLLAAGISLAILGLYNQAQLQVRGIEMASAINLIIGGILAIGLCGVISALDHGPRHDMAYAGDEAEVPAVAETTAPAPAAEATVEEKPAEAAPAPRPMRFPSFGRKVQEAGLEAPAATATVVAATVTEAAAPAAAAARETVTPAVKETIDALEQAKTDLENALTGSDSVEEMAAEEQVTEPGEGELFVVEDKVIRGRQARILSDGTVEAETDEGWMRFENLEHLDEYLDAVEQA